VMPIFSLNQTEGKKAGKPSLPRATQGSVYSGRLPVRLRAAQRSIDLTLSIAEIRSCRQRLSANP